jgi:hypothetical protein
MGFWDFLVPAELPYPGMSDGTTQTGQGAGSSTGQPANAGGSGSGFLDKVFTPAELPYPMPVGSVPSLYPSMGLTGMTQPQAPATCAAKRRPSAAAHLRRPRSTGRSIFSSGC